MSGLGKAIKDARMTRGLTMQELADKVGVTAGAVSNWENGWAEPSDYNLQSLLKNLPNLKAWLDGQPGSMGRTSPVDGTERLKQIASLVQEGAEQTATVREILSWFGAYRRGYWVIEGIRTALHEAGLSTTPDFEAGYIDGQVQFTLLTPPTEQHQPAASIKSEPAVGPDASYTLPRTETGEILSDPSYRISRFTDTSRPVVSVTPDATLLEAVTLMRMHDFTQVPVMTSNREVKGIVTWASIGSQLSTGASPSVVREFMVDHQELREDESLSKAIPIIAEHGYVLVRASDRRIIGIVTSSDLALQYHQLAEPFLLLGEIENHIRGIIDGHFTLEELTSVKDSADVTRTITGVKDLTFGEYVRLLENPDRWLRLKLPVDRRTFMDTLGQVKDVRNDVMHFDPDPLTEQNLKTLRSFAAFLRGIQR